MRCKPPVYGQPLVPDIRHNPLTRHDVELVRPRTEIRYRVCAAGIGDTFSGIDILFVYNLNSDSGHRLSAAVQNPANQVGAQRHPCGRYHDRRDRDRRDQDLRDVRPFRRSTPPEAGKSSPPQARVRHPLGHRIIGVAKDCIERAMHSPNVRSPASPLRLYG